MLNSQTKHIPAYTKKSIYNYSKYALLVIIIKNYLKELSLHVFGKHKPKIKYQSFIFLNESQAYVL